MNLYRAQDGHYYTKAVIQGTSQLATFQISPVAKNHLESLGIQIGEEIPRHVFSFLHSEGLIFTGGSGPSDEVAIDVSPRVLDALIKWGIQGKSNDLQKAVSRAGTSIANCITPGFIKWVCSFESNLELADLSGISFSDFDRYVHQSNNSKLNSLHFELIKKDGGSRVLWSLTRLVAHVASYPGSPDQIPDSWQGTVYQIFANLIRDAFSSRPLPEPPQAPQSKILLPEIYWQVQEQQVVGILPAQTLPAGEELSWKVVPGDDFQVSIRQLHDKTVVSESITEPLEPASWKIDVEHRDKQRNTFHHSVEIQIPSPHGPYVIFEENGKAISWKPDLILPPGTYYVLAAPTVDIDEFYSTEGLEILEEIDYEPVAWWDWKGFCVSIISKVKLGSYTFDLSDIQIDWELVDPPELEVDISGMIPTWLNRWPQLIIKASDETILQDSILEIERTEDGKFWNLYMCPDDDYRPDRITYSKEDDKILIDFSQCKQFTTFSGSYAVRLLFSRVIEKTPNKLHFKVISGVQFDYVNDPNRPGQAKALSIRGAKSVTTYPGCGDIFRDDSYILYAEDPVEEPLIHFSMRPQGLGPEMLLAVRLRVSRISYLSPKTPLGNWVSLPLDIKLYEVEDLNARLKLELHSMPEVNDNELLGYLDGNEPVSAGKQISPYTFVIPLHRWLDNLGPAISGTIQVNCENTWLTMVKLLGREERTKGDVLPAKPPRSIYDSWFDEASQVEYLALAGQYVEADQKAEILATRVRTEDLPLTVKHLLLARLGRVYIFIGSFDRATELLPHQKETGGLPAVRYSGAILEMRAHFPGDRFRTLKQDIDTWEEYSQKQLAMAEWSYRLGRMGKGGEGALRAVYDTYLRNFVSHLLADQAEAAIFCGISHFLLSEPCNFDSKLEFVPWFRTIQKAQSYLHTSLGHWDFNGDSSVGSPPWPTSICNEDITYLRAIDCQANGNIQDAGRYLRQLAKSRLNFPRIDLLRARQARLEGNIESAKDLYIQIIDLDIVLEEMVALGKLGK